MLTFTLDTNCLIDVDENRSNAQHVLALAEAHVKGTIDVALVAVSASERQPGDTYLNNYADFEQRIARLGLAHLPVLPALAYWDIGFWGKGFYPNKVMVDRERTIHETLFPNIPFDWPDFAKSLGVDPSMIRLPEAKRWRNAFCDRQMYWAHDHHGRNVFVTRDKNFSRLVGAEGFSSAKIASPKEAIAMLPS